MPKCDFNKVAVSCLLLFLQVQIFTKFNFLERVRSVR